MKTLADYQTMVDNLVRDDESRITTTQRDNAIDLGRWRYSKDRPVEKVEDVAGLGTRFLDLPPAWVSDFSVVKSIEYPIGDVPPTLIDSIEFYRSPADLKFFLDTVIPSAVNARVTFTIPHTLDGSTNTIPDKDMEPVASYAASVLCEELSSLYSGDTDSTLAADNVDHQSKAREFSSRARGLRQRYYDALGIDPKRLVAAGAVVDLDLKDSHGQGRLTHGEKYR